METQQEFRTVKDLVDLHANEMARPNPEYQRGAVWKIEQKKKLIDSVLRGYQLPMIYLHYNETKVGDMVRQSFDIIDGQQRLTALHHFAEGAFSLLDPSDPKAKFPKFIQEQPCEWSGKDIHGLSPQLREQFFTAEIPVAKITSDDQNEIRDLFVRLQSGFPLNAQEKRDANPGQFTEFILSLGGKPEILKHRGHDFFKNALGAKPRTDRGKTRQLAAQIAMLFFSRRTGDQFPDTNAGAINDYYYTNLDFDANSKDCQRLREILDKLDEILGNGKHPRLRGHEAIHLVLLLDSLWDDYTRSWESRLQAAHGQFSKLLTEATMASKRGEQNETWLHYGIRTRAGADRGENIQSRHQYYASKMVEFIGNLTPKDPRRNFGQLEREIIYWRDSKKCQVCDADVQWVDAEIHHIDEHSKGGRTELDNGALGHRHCHPKGADQTQAFARKIEERRKAPEVASDNDRSLVADLLRRLAKAEEA